MSRSSHRKTEQCLEARNERGFTLTELLIVVAIIGILAAGTYRLSPSGDGVVVSVP